MNRFWKTVQKILDAFGLLVLAVGVGVGLTELYLKGFFFVDSLILVFLCACLIMYLVMCFTSND